MNKNGYILATNAAGLSNKAHAWAAAWELANINNKQLVQDWQGDQHLLSLPDTVHISEIENNLSWVELNSNSLNEPFILEQDKNYKLTCGFDYNRNLCKQYSYQNLFRGIQLTHPVLKDIIELTKNKNLIGLHIRRSDFFKPTLTDSDFVWNTTQVDISWYLSVMKDLQKTNKNLTFYIASEEASLILPLLKDFNVIDRTIFNIDLTERPAENYVIHLADLIDLFVLKHINCFVETPRSSFSHFASLVNDNPTITSSTYKGYFLHKRNFY